MSTIAGGVIIAMIIMGALLLACLLAYDLFLRVLDYNHRRRSQLRERRLTPTKEFSPKASHVGPASANR